MSKHKSGKFGFTLVELMIVCAIIAVLVGVATPSYISYRRQSRQTACVSLLRQMQAAKETWYSHATEGYTWQPSFVCGTGKIFPDQSTLKCPESGQALNFGQNDGYLPYCSSFQSDREYPHSLTACFTY